MLEKRLLCKTRRMRERGWGRGLSAVAMLLSVLLLPKPASAHAVLVDSTPKVKSTVNGPDLEILLRYNSRIDAARCSLSLLVPGGEVRPLAIGVQSGPASLAAKAAGLTPGAYILRWSALSSDGHITRGEIAFHVR